MVIIPLRQIDMIELFKAFSRWLTTDDLLAVRLCQPYEYLWLAKRDLESEIKQGMLNLQRTSMQSTCCNQLETYLGKILFPCEACSLTKTQSCPFFAASSIFFAA